MTLQPFKPIYQQQHDAVALISQGYNLIRQQEELDEIQAQEDAQVLTQTEEKGD